jgi:hypothetical protein
MICTPFMGPGLILPSVLVGFVASAVLKLSEGMALFAARHISRAVVRDIRRGKSSTLLFQSAHNSIIGLLSKMAFIKHMEKQRLALVACAANAEPKKSLGLEPCGLVAKNRADVFCLRRNLSEA